VNRYFKPSHLPFVTLAAGMLGLILRIWLKRTGTDGEGLLLPNHPAQILIYVLTALFLVYNLLCVRPLNAIKRYSDLFPEKWIPGIGCFFAAAGILTVIFRERTMRSDLVTAVCLWLGILSAICMIVLAVYRFRRRRPPCYFHVIITLFLMTHLISQYRLWSSDPQIQNYAFSLLSSVCIMLSNFYSAAFDANEGQRRPHAFFHLASVYFCLVSLPYCEDPLFYFSMALWMFTDLCNLTPMPRRKR
jgi:hypothetical protein